MDKQRPLSILILTVAPAGEVLDSRKFKIQNYRYVVQQAGAGRCAMHCYSVRTL